MNGRYLMIAKVPVGRSWFGWRRTERTEVVFDAQNDEAAVEWAKQVQRSALNEPSNLLAVHKIVYEANT